MIIPSKFESILKSNQVLYLIVLDVATSFQPIYDDNKLFFFEEYTDHGIQHIESVMASSEYIISDKLIENFTAKEVAILILSIILHDVGMQCEFSTFVSLLRGDYDKVRIATLDSKTWNELWLEYLSEVKRFSSQQKKNIFGNEHQQYKEPDLSNKDNLSGFDKKLIGEFIRRHHSRLSHEIALNGIYGSNGKKIDFGNDKLSHLYKQLIGIVARSHGMDLRETFSYLQEVGSQGWRNPDDINVVFLMVVLRIADYIQIDNKRANPILLKLKTFNSPISMNEHDAHLAISSISFNQPDSERIFVTCNPKNSEMLIKLKSLFIDIQKELDTSWAVLGEVYGFLSSKIPHIKYRRITSNLNDSGYLNKLDFVSQRIKFEVNNDLSKLLVGPLYGNNPTYGVRELVQNSVDACTERNHVENKIANSSYIPKIVVSITRIDEEKSIFQIRDNGKGMSIDEIIYYFLNVGSSFRKSLSWKKQFIDEQGHTLINRNGKFGIGVLAAFLLGDELTIKTKHYNEKNSYSFTTTIDSDFINIKKDVNQIDEIGTTISLVISKHKREELLQEKKSEYEKSSMWTNWYVNDFPKVEYLLDDKKISTSMLIERTDMHSFQTDNFKRIEWKYFGDRTSSINKIVDTLVVCNGIIVTTNLDYKKNKFVFSDKKNNEYVIEKKPSFLFEDAEGIFPIKLDRNDIDCIQLPFEKELYCEVAKDFIAQILCLRISDTSRIAQVQIKNTKAKLLFHSDGFSLNFDYFINILKEKGHNLIRVISNYSHISNVYSKYPDSIIYPSLNEKINLSYQESNVAPASGRILLKIEKYIALFKGEKKRLATWINNQHSVILENERIVIYDFLGLTGLYTSKSTMFKNLLTDNKIDIEEIESIQELDFDYLKIKGGETLNNFLKEYIGEEVIIPYSIEDRKKKYEKAFVELDRFVEKHIVSSNEL